MDAKRRRSSLADFIKTERIKRNETAVEDIKSDVNNRQVISEDKTKIERRTSQLSTIDDNRTLDEETSALYPLRIRREQTRHSRNSKWYDESRKNAIQNVIDKELCGIAPDEPNIDHIPRGFAKRRRFSVIQDNEGSSFTKEDKLRALEEEGGNQSRSLKSGRSRRTSRSTRTLNSIPSSSYPGSRSGSVNYDVQQESISKSKGLRQESILMKNDRNFEDLWLSETAKQDQDRTIERDVKDDQVIRVEITRGKSGRKQNNVVILQVGEPAKENKDKESDGRHGDIDRLQVSVESHFEDGQTKKTNNADINKRATYNVKSGGFRNRESFKNVDDRNELSGNPKETKTKDNRETIESVTPNVSSGKVTAINDSENISHKDPKEILSTEKVHKNPKEIASTQEVPSTNKEPKGISSTNTSQKYSIEILCPNTHKDLEDISPTISQKDPKNISSTNTSLKDPKEILSTDTSHKDTKEIRSRYTSLKDPEEISPTDAPLKDQKSISSKTPDKDPQEIPLTNTPQNDKKKISSNASYKDPQEIPSTNTSHKEPKKTSSTNTSLKDQKKISSRASYKNPKETPSNPSHQKGISSINTSRKDPNKNPSTKTSHKDPKKIPSANTSQKESKMIPSKNTLLRNPKEIHFTNTSQNEPKEVPSTNTSHKDPKEILSTNISKKDSVEILSTNGSFNEPKDIPSTYTSHNDRKENPSNISHEKEIPSINMSHKDPNEIFPTIKSSEVVHTQSRDSSCDDRSGDEDQRHASNHLKHVQLLNDRETNTSETQLSPDTNKVYQTDGSSQDITTTDVGDPNGGESEKITLKQNKLDIKHTNGMKLTDNEKLNESSVPQSREVNSENQDKNVISNTQTELNIYNVSDKQGNKTLDLPEATAVYSSKCSSRMSKISNDDYRSLAASMKSLMKEEQECSEMFVRSLQDVRTYNAKLYKNPKSRQFSEVAVLERWLKSQEIQQTRTENSKQAMEESFPKKIQIYSENDKHYESEGEESQDLQRGKRPSENDGKESPDIQKGKGPGESDGKEMENIDYKGQDMSFKQNLHVPVEENETHLENKGCEDQKRKEEPHPELNVNKSNGENLGKKSSTRREILEKENPDLPSENNDEEMENKSSHRKEVMAERNLDVSNQNKEPNKIDHENKVCGEKATNEVENRYVSNNNMEKDLKNCKNERKETRLEVYSAMPYMKNEVDFENLEHERKDSRMTVHSNVQDEESDTEMENESKKGKDTKVEENPDVSNQSKAIEKNLKGLIIEENHLNKEEKTSNLEVTKNSTGNIDDLVERSNDSSESEEELTNHFVEKQVQSTDPNIHNNQMSAETQSECFGINDSCLNDESLQDIRANGHTKNIDDTKNESNESKDTPKNENAVEFATLVKTNKTGDQEVYDCEKVIGTQDGAFTDNLEDKAFHNESSFDNEANLKTSNPSEEHSKINSEKFETEQDISSFLDNQRLEQGDDKLSPKRVEDINSTESERVNEEVEQNNNEFPYELSCLNRNLEIADTPVKLDPSPTSDESKSRKSSPKRIEILIRDDDKSRENDLTVVIELPTDGSNVAEKHNSSEVKEQSCQTDTEINPEKTTVLPPLKCEPPLVQRRERSFIRLHHETTSLREELDPDVLYFIKQAERRQRSKVDDILRELYQMKHADVLRSPQKTCLDFSGVLESHPRFFYGYSCGDFESMVIKANKFDNNVRRYLGYTKRADRLQNIEHSKKYRAYMDLRKKLKHLY
ncbi:putative uncharacterized protein DDB_G0282133 [Saccostrea echinata]|uniref:putative uncharacterized protein DDB_G0282133 n=1 Tax=Saccostrea echinata TaxID=191078 RepID=UPI002A811B61|nr:putative uncharacterized protein DDB_G0282133 [Saccostrea echinata]